MLDWTRTTHPDARRSVELDQCGSMCNQCLEDIPLSVDEQGRYVEEVHVCS